MANPCLEWERETQALAIVKHVANFLEQGTQREGSRAFDLWRHLRGCMPDTHHL